MPLPWLSLHAFVSSTLLISGVLTGIALIAWAFFSRAAWASRLMGILTVVGSATLFVISVSMMFLAPSSAPVQFAISLIVIHLDFYVDALSVLFILIVNTIAFAASWNSLAYLKGIIPDSSLQEPTAFHLLVNIFHLTMLLVPMINNLIGVWIAIELTTLGSALLVAFRDKRTSWEATWKYLIITSIGIIVALLGTMFLANAIPLNTTDKLVNQPAIEQDQVMNWTYLMAHDKSLTPTESLVPKNKLDPAFVWLAFLFAMVGYGTKAGLAPMHTWLPDGHGEAPSPISALLSGVLLKSALYAILRFYTLTNLVLGESARTSAVLLGAGLLSLLVSTPLILKENPFKRVLAYHSLEHMGIITFAIGLGGPIALFGALLHALNHAITKAFMFLAFGNVIKQYRNIGIEQAQISGVLRSMPLTGSMLTLGGLALVGSPPFNIFISEYIILWGAFSGFSEKEVPQQLKIVVAVSLFILSTTLIFYGLVRHLSDRVLHKAPADPQLEKLGWSETAPLVFLFILMLGLGLWIYPPLANLINASVKIILNQ